MSVPNVAKLVVSEGYYMSGMTDKNHLSRYIQDYGPEKFSQIMIQAFSNRQIDSNPLLELTEGQGKVRYLSGQSDSWTWDMALSRYKPLRIVENLESGNLTAGLDGIPFRLKLDKDWFTNGDVISCDRRNTQVRIGEEPIYQESNGFVYTVYLVTDSPATDYYPQKNMASAVEYVKLYSMYPERASQASKLHFLPTAKLLDYLPDMIRLEHEITGYADKRVLMTATAGPDGTPQNNPRWFKRAELEFWKTFYKMQNDSLTWGRTSTHLKGESGYNLRTPHGLWQKLDLGNVYHYGKFSIKLLEEYLISIFFGRVDGKNRDVVLLTGEYGMKLFSQAIRDEVGSFGLFINSDKAITGTGRDMGFGYQFTKFYPINGGTVTLKWLPSLDTDLTNFEKGNGAFPPTSATFIILDLSGDNSDNIQLVKHKEAEEYGYIVGTASPFGPLNGSLISNARDGYSMIGKTRCGIHINDLTRTGKLVMDTN